MDKRFDVVLLKDAEDFVESLEADHHEKILYNIWKAQLVNDPELFKKIEDPIWEFRTLYNGIHYRLLAFWDKTNTKKTLVLATHGFIKKQDKVPKKEIAKAIRIMNKYFKDKQNENVHT